MNVKRFLQTGQLSHLGGGPRRGLWSDRDVGTLAAVAGAAGSVAVVAGLGYLAWRLVSPDEPQAGSPVARVYDRRGTLGRS